MPVAAIPAANHSHAEKLGSMGELCEEGSRDADHAGDLSRLLSRSRLSFADHSHSIVPGGLLVMSNTTRFTPFTSLVIRELRCSKMS